VIGYKRRGVVGADQEGASEAAVLGERRWAKMSTRRDEETDQILRWLGYRTGSGPGGNGGSAAVKGVRQVRGDENAEEVPYGCFCLGTGYFYTDVATGVSVRACGYLHAVAEIEKRLKNEDEE
jgi:hypothetical protein